MITKQFEMFYFDDHTFIALCRQLERELKSLKEWSADSLTDLRLAYEKFELFLSVYFRSKGRDDIDYKLEVRTEIAMALNVLSESTDDENVTPEYRKEKFTEARDNLIRVLEDLLYQIRIVTI
jgi:hypothetical protein